MESGKLWDIMENCGKLWKTVENCGKLCEIMENMMIFNGILWGIQQSGAFRTNIS